MNKMTKTFAGGEVKCQLDELGYTKDELKVTAATDAAGSQVIIYGSNVHLLSRPLENHAAAVALGKKVVVDGPSVYNEWKSLPAFGVAVAGEALILKTMVLT